LITCLVTCLDLDDFFDGCKVRGGRAR
jgi:hypothetical protein